jgi:hypothetical protein
MEKRTLTSVIALTFLMAGTATFAMDKEVVGQEKTGTFPKSTKFFFDLPQDLKKGRKLELTIDTKEGENWPSMTLSGEEEISTGNFLSGYKCEIKKHVIGSILEKKETIISSNNSLQTKIDTLIVEEDTSSLPTVNTEFVESIPLTFTKSTAKEYSENDGIIMVTTDDNANATYQVVTNRLTVEPDQKFILKSNVALAKGKMSFGVLNTKSNGWIDGEEIFLKPGFYAGVKEFVIPNHESEISLVLRNYHLGTNGGAGQSKFTAKLELEKVEVISKRNVSDDTGISQTDNTPSTPLSIPLISSNKTEESNKIEEPIKLLKTPEKKRRGQGFFSWLFGNKEEPVTEEEVNELPSDRAYLNAALKMKESNATDFDVLMKYAKATTKKDIPEGAQKVVTMLIELSKNFKGIKNVLNEGNILKEDMILLELFLKELRSAYVLKLQENVKYQPTQSFIINIPKNILEENEKN